MTKVVIKSIKLAWNEGRDNARDQRARFPLEEAKTTTKPESVNHDSR